MLKSAYHRCRYFVAHFSQIRSALALVMSRCSVIILSWKIAETDVLRTGARKHLFLLSVLILRGWEERYGAHIQKLRSGTP